MLRPTAMIKVLCRADTFEETLNLLAWAVGHRVEIPEAAPLSDAKYVFIYTDLGYNDDDENILANLGLDIIGKISGVLSWEVVASNHPGVEPIPPEQAKDAIIAEQQSLEDMLMQALESLPLKLALTRHPSGSYVWKWFQASGQATTFMSAIMGALAHAMTAYAAMYSELHPKEDAAEQRAESLEAELARQLSALPIPVTIVQSGDGSYVWKWADKSGQANTFVSAMTDALSQAIATYIAARRELMGR